MTSNATKEIKLNDVAGFYAKIKFKFLLIFLSFFLLTFLIAIYLENTSKRIYIKIEINNSAGDSLNLINYSLVSFSSKLQIEEVLPIEKFNTDIFSKKLIGLPNSIDWHVLNNIILNSNIKNISLESISNEQDIKANTLRFVSRNNLNDNFDNKFKENLLNHIKTSLNDIYLRHKFLSTQISNFYLENIEISKQFLTRQAQFEVAQLQNHLEFQYNLAKQLNIEIPQEKPNFDMRFTINTSVNQLDFLTYYYSMNYTIGYKLLGELIINLKNFDVKNSKGISNLFLAETMLQTQSDDIIDKQIKERIDLFEPDILIDNVFYLFKKSDYYLVMLLTSLALSILVTYSFFIYNFFKQEI